MRRYIKRGAALIDTQGFGFRYSSVLTPRRNAMPGHRVTTTAFTATILTPQAARQVVVLASTGCRSDLMIRTVTTRR